MTSQVIIFTKRFGILATDRQQTLADGKTYTGVKKIFELSRLHSAGVMLNGNPDLDDVPMETLIAEFKAGTDFKEIGTVEEIADRFINFLSKSTDSSSVDEYVSSRLKYFRYNLISEIDEFGFFNIIEERRKKDICPFIKEYSDYDNEFDDIIPEDADKDEYLEILWQIFSFDLQNDVTGIVLAGFDLKNHYPSFFEIEIYFNNNGKMIYEIVDSAANSKKPIVKVFAINEEAYTFITGVNDEFIEFILKYVADANQSIVDSFKLDIEKNNIENSDIVIELLKKAQNKEYSKIVKHIDKFRLSALIDTTYSIENLPEWLISIFADLLIRLTAVKQKTSSEIESVSIESDILIISKVDGLKWLKTEDRIL